MRDVSSQLAARLRGLENPLATVLSIHLFTEYLLDQMIRLRSPVAADILKDHRSYTFSVKLTLVYHMNLINRPLFRNLRGLNGMRNEYAHEIDVDLARGIGRGFVDRETIPVFPGTQTFLRSVRNDRQSAAIALLAIRDVTFGWLHDIAEDHGILN